MSRTRSMPAVIAVTCVALMATAASAVPASAAARPGVVNCKGKATAKPKEINLSCADANLMVTGLKWSAWTNNMASGTGTLVWNPCIPTCVAGKAEKFPAKVTLGRLASGAGVSVFSGMTLAFPKGGPADAATSTYALDNPLK